MTDRDGRPPTERDDDGDETSSRHPTEQEPHGPGAGPKRPLTEHEGFEAEPGRSRSGSVLPGALSGAYDLGRQFGRAGGEANLFEVLHRESGERRLLKLYFSDIRLKDGALKRVQAINGEHVIRLHDFGQDDDGRWYEVQELIAGGDLVALRDQVGGSLNGRRLMAVVDELNRALVAFHAADLAHHDIKPENVLVRTTKPLDLVLADFGLSVIADEDVTFASNRNATFEYQAPETMAKQGGAARDRWAMGLTIAMLASGKAPYSGLNEHAILHSHMMRQPPPILDDVRDLRVRALCQGLTRYEVANRWGAAETEAWLRGEDPPVLPDEPPTTSPRRVAVRFNDTDYTDRGSLAEALLANPKVAESAMTTAARRQSFLDAIVTAFNNADIAELDSRWSARAPSAGLAVTELVVALHQSAPPSYQGRRLDPAGVAVLGHDAAQGDADAAKVVAAMLEQPILTAWGRGSIAPGLGEVERRWHQYRAAFDGHEQAARSAGVDRAPEPPVDAWLLAAAAGDRFLGALVKLRDDVVRGGGVGTQDWFGPMATATDPAGVVAGLVFAPEAQRRDLAERSRVAAEQARDREERERAIAERRRALRKWKTLATFLATAGAFAGPYAYLRPGEGEPRSNEPFSLLRAGTLLNNVDVTRLSIAGDASIALQVVAATVGVVTSVGMILILGLAWARRPGIVIKIVLISVITIAAVAAQRAAPSLAIRAYYQLALDRQWNDGLYCDVQSAEAAQSATAICNLPYETASSRGRRRPTIRLAVFDLTTVTPTLRFEREVELFEASASRMPSYLTEVVLTQGAGRALVFDPNGVQAFDALTGEPVWSRPMSSATYDVYASGGPDTVENVGRRDEGSARRVAGLDQTMQVVSIRCTTGALLLLNATDGVEILNSGCG